MCTEKLQYYTVRVHNNCRHNNGYCTCSITAVVVWCDGVGDIQWRTITLPWSGPSRNGGAAGDRQEDEQTHQCCLH